MRASFTMQNTLQEILNESGPTRCFFISPGFLSCVPEDWYGYPLSKLGAELTMPWGLPFPAEEILNEANLTLNPDRYWKLLPLWTERPVIGSNSMDSVVLMKLTDTPSGDDVRPAVIICPGGGYEDHAGYGEGIAVARRMEQAGYRAFILFYRVAPGRQPVANYYPAPQLDLALAVRYVRLRASELRVDPHNLMTMGFSAGGHLAASEAALFPELEALLDKEAAGHIPWLSDVYAKISCRPDKVCLCYPVISFLSEYHEGSYLSLTGGDEALREKLSVEKQVTGRYPKTFIWTVGDDTLVPPSNTTRLDAALSEQGVPHLTRIYPTGGHGCGTGDGTSAAPWLEEMLAYMA